MLLPEEGHMSSRNMLELYGKYKILPYIYAHLLVLISIYMLRSVEECGKSMHYLLSGIT